MVPSHFIRILELPDDERAAIDTSSLRLIVHGGRPLPGGGEAPDDGRLPRTPRSTSSTGRARAGPPASPRTSGSSVPAASAARGRAWRSGSSTQRGSPGPPGPTGWSGSARRGPTASPTATTPRPRRAPGATTPSRVGDIGHRRRGGLPDHHRPGVGHGAVGRGQHRPARDRRGALRPSRRGRLRRVRHPRRARRRAPQGHGGAARGRPTTDELATSSARAWPTTRSPTPWEIVDELPRDPNGKVLKRLLRQQSRV